MAETLAILRAEHEVMRKLLDVLAEQIDRFEKAENTDYDLMKEILDYFLTFPDLYHHPKENLIHARMLRRGGPAAEGLHDIPAEHEHVSGRLHAFARALVSVMLEAEYPRDEFVLVARKFVDGERHHMNGEENGFFPAAEKALKAEDWMEIDARMAALKDPLITGQYETKFPLIRECI